MRSSLRYFVLAALLSGCAAFRPATDNVDINLVALNDLHGNLEATRFDDGKAGGLDTIAAALKDWRKDDPNLLLVGAGDMIGASPALSAMWADEPTINALNMLGLRVTSAGNHEFDQGRNELLRQAKGGCASPRPDKACKYAPVYDGAKFSYLAANVIETRSNSPLLPAYTIEEVKGVKIAFIGAVLKDLPDMVAASGISGLQVLDEAPAINKLLPKLREEGATVFVVLIHQGGKSESAKEGANDGEYCDDLKGDIVNVVKQLDPAIRLVISGHSHKAYLCKVDGRLVTQAETAGHMLSRIRMVVDKQTHAVVDVSARNIVMEPGRFGAEPEAKAFVAALRERSQAALAKPVATLGASMIAKPLMAGTEESALGQVVADATLLAGRPWGAQIAFMNTGGVRTSLETKDGHVATMGDVQAVLPFGNELVVMNMTGEQIRELLEEQWMGSGADKRGFLQVSEGFTYQYDTRKPVGERILTDSVMLNGVRIEDSSSYRVAANAFIAAGGDGFTTFKKGSNRVQTGVRDADSLAQYLVRRENDRRPVGQVAASQRFMHAN
jgi:5'-nucleotidase